ncbi:MAG: hypothetical protein A2636_07005 [Elusimicrobia bacterium RIFCSPHIGHO2_01_FULL_64_10]|nr:MAG: hypothetical protein A2636_07005 [Elusimicrobia bacterium RIFCSPHIGHO2_01_FULL_64_10]
MIARGVDRGAVLKQALLFLMELETFLKVSLIGELPPLPGHGDAGFVGGRDLDVLRRLEPVQAVGDGAVIGNRGDPGA